MMMMMMMMMVLIEGARDVDDIDDNG